MVVKATTKKKLLDLGCPQYLAHRWADDRNWYTDIVPMNFDDIMDEGGLFKRKFNANLTTVEIGIIYDIVKAIRENELDRMSGIDPLRIVVGTGVPGGQKTAAEYIKMIENFGRIPAGSPYYYLIEDSLNFINWPNENPLEGK